MTPRKSWGVMLGCLDGAKGRSRCDNDNWRRKLRGLPQPSRFTLCLIGWHCEDFGKTYAINRRELAGQQASAGEIVAKQTQN